MKKPLPDAVQRQLDETNAYDADLAAQAAAPPAPELTPPAPEPVAPPPEPTPAPTVDWEQRYKTLQGKYNTEVPALQTQVRDLSDKVEKLAAPPATPAPAKDHPPQVKLVTDKDTEEFGAELVDLIRRCATEVAGPDRTRLEAEIAELKAQLPDLKKDMASVATSQAEDRRATYFVDLTKVVADWEAVNVDEGFIEWLKAKDPLSGIARGVLLGDAFDKFDVTRTATVFNTWKQETGKTAPAADPQPEPAPASGLEKEVSPGKSRSAETPMVTDGKIWTNAEVGEFYQAVTRGDYRSSPQEAQRIDAEIDKALVEGRVKG